jgi:CheY-like chemotaxis protein
MIAKKILVVDDEPDVVSVIEARLKGDGYQVIIACDGKESLEKAKAQKPDLILLDIKMPDMDGHKILKGLKEDDETKSIPVIMLTASSEPVDVIKSLSYEGAVDYIVKPFNTQDFLRKIRKY